MSLSYSHIMQRQLIIPTDRQQGPWFDVVSGDEGIAWALWGLIGRARRERLADYCLGTIIGSCNDQFREAIFPHAARGFGDPDSPDSFKAVIGSRGTLRADGKPMVTQLPSYLARLYKVLAFSTTPNTARMHLRSGTGRVGMGEFDIGFDTGQHQVVVVVDQERPGKNSGHEEEVRGHLRAIRTVSTVLEVATFSVMYGGNNVAVMEALGGLLYGIPLIVVDGTERAANNISAAIRRGHFMDVVKAHIEYSDSFLSPDDLHRFADLDVDAMTHIADIRDPRTLREGLARFLG